MNTITKTQDDLAAYFGFTARHDIEVDGETYTIPNPAMLDDDQDERWQELQLIIEKCERDDDGELLTPYRIDGEPLTPTYNSRLATVLWGDRAKAYVAGGGQSSLVALVWARMARELNGE